MAISSHNNPPLLREEVDVMSDKELQEKLIQQYVDLQRIKNAPDRDVEIERQIATVKAKLEAFGTVTEKLDF